MQSRERMLAAVARQPVDRPPVWVMRQAGRYLPEYMALRQEHSFWDIVRAPELAREVALQPLRRFPGLDASILFSDILVLLDAMGAEVTYTGSGPHIGRPFTGEDDLERLAAVDVATDLAYVGGGMEALVEAVRPERAVIGFAGAPLTLATYLVEGGPSRDLRHLKALSYRDPELAQRLLLGLADQVADLLLLQIDAGADLVQVFDSWALHLCPDDYRELAVPSLTRIVDRVAGRAPVVVYFRGAATHLEAVATTGAPVLALDPSIRLDEARRRAPDGVALQGNLDPAELLGPPARIRARVHRLIDLAGPQGLVLNLGLGMVPNLPPAGVEAFVEAVEAWR